MGPGFLHGIEEQLRRTFCRSVHKECVPANICFPARAGRVYERRWVRPNEWTVLMSEAGRGMLLSPLVFLSVLVVRGLPVRFYAQESEGVSPAMRRLYLRSRRVRVGAGIRAEGSSPDTPAATKRNLA